MKDAPVFPVTKLAFAARREESPGIFTYRFTPEVPVPFSAGSYAHLRVPGVSEGEKSVHEFSFASAPGEEQLQFGIDTRSGSPYQRALAALMPGDGIELFKIRSHLTWPPDAADAVMIAGGIGVTPFRSMLRDAKRQASRPRVTLIHASRESHPYAAELERLADERRACDRSGLPEILAHTAAKLPYAHYYVAGSAGFVDGVAKQLSAAGISQAEQDDFKGLSEASV